MVITIVNIVSYNWNTKAWGKCLHSGLSDSQSELEEEEDDDGFVGGTGVQSDKGQSGMESEGVDEEVTLFERTS